MLLTSKDFVSSLYCDRRRIMVLLPCLSRASKENLIITFELNTKDDDTSKEDVSAAFTTVVVVIE